MPGHALAQFRQPQRFGVAEAMAGQRLLRGSDHRGRRSTRRLADLEVKNMLARAWARCSTSSAMNGSMPPRAETFKAILALSSSATAWSTAGWTPTVPDP